MNAMQAVVVMLTNLLVARDYETAAAMTRGRRLSAADLERAISEYGQTLVRLPPEALEDFEIYQVQDTEPPTFELVVDLWTREEGRSDLTLELELVDRFNGAYEVSIQSLHVL